MAMDTDTIHQGAKTGQTQTVDAAHLREMILRNPERVLSDPDIMSALIHANDAANSNVVDLRSIAMARLEQRLDHLQTTHRSVVATVYDNLSGTTQVHRAVLKLIEPTDFVAFLRVVKNDIPHILGIDFTRLILETTQDTPDPSLASLSDILVPAPPGFIQDYLGRSGVPTGQRVILRQVRPDDDVIYGEAAAWIKSEACLRLGLGPGTLPAMLVLGADDSQQFKATHGTDLLAFFAMVFETTMRRWLA